MEHLSRNAKTISFVVDLVTVIAVFFLTFSVAGAIAGHQISLLGSRRYMETEILCFTSWSLALALLAEYPSRRTSGVLRDLEVVVKLNVLALLLFSCTSFVFKAVDVSRIFIGTYLCLAMVSMFLNRYIVRFVLYLLRQSGWDLRSRVLVGNSENVIRYLNEVASDRKLGLRVTGYIACEHNRSLPIPYLGPLEEIGEILSRYTPDGVVIALGITDPNLEHVIRACEEQGVSMELLLDGLSTQIANSSIYHGPTISSLLLSAIPHTPISLFLKRVTDVVVSLLAIVLLSPIMLFVALAIKLEDGGPVFFRQQRVGLRNKPFDMYKFRSMRVDAEALKESILHLNEMSGPVFKLMNDPRVTKVGAFIRRTSIDEIPQFFNVLVGNMSLVGPRPPLPSEVNEYEHVYRRRLSVRPGMTCLWQISGRNEIDFEQWMSLDLRYIDNWSYLQDWKILAMTIPAVLKKNGAR
ncbi:sugar transferase [Alicyclobacillus fastidiosus]|uniref:Sugar transferase n=1 Tax=Alicyclobacillus fastidiosus TaxID=392011 RepID=A0ABY6ZAJ4_9BACL|nr:sugar transferase [Alicyclobacillus fastidiosus]WAH39908.1 sugar transferase [Alicyclobacillus fastidiosus]